MAKIKYASIINAYISTEGSNGFMTNYIYYSVLVAYDNGFRDIVQGKLEDIARYAPYIRTPMDELDELKETVRSLRNDINAIADQKVTYVIDSMFPMPAVQGLNEVEAVRLIEGAGLKPVFINDYPENTPKNGVVRAYFRNDKNFRNVDLDIIHVLPDVTGMKIEAAQALLAAAGFTVNITYTMLSDHENGIVLKCERADETSLTAELNVSLSVPNTTGMRLAEALNALKNQGFEAVVERVVSNDEPDMVQKWASVDDKTVKLWATQPREVKPRSANIKWTNLPDSTGDHYSVDAVYKNSTKNLAIDISFTNGSKTKYKISGITHNVGERFSDVHIYDPVVMDPGARGILSFELRPKNFKDDQGPVDSVAITLEAYYGIMKKTVQIPMEITFEW